MDAKIKNIIIVLVFVVIVVVLFFVLGKNTDIQNNQVTQEEKKIIQENTLGGTIYDALPQNPVEKIPETNPFKAEVNPFKGAYTNPFGN